MDPGGIIVLLFWPATTLRWMAGAYIFVNIVSVIISRWGVGGDVCMQATLHTYIWPAGAPLPPPPTSGSCVNATESWMMNK